MSSVVHLIFLCAGQISSRVDEVEVCGCVWMNVDLFYCQQQAELDLYVCGFEHMFFILKHCYCDYLEIIYLDYLSTIKNDIILC